MLNNPPPLDRTPSNHARYLTAGVRCFERDFPGHEKKMPVKMVVFDCDETLTLSTFMPKNKELRTQIGWIEWAEFIANVNFESPFVDGSRIEKMGECFTNLKIGEDGQERTLTILTRNESGAIACLNLLMMAKLDQHFDAVWSMQATSNLGTTNACYKNGSRGWEKFQSPVGRCFDHKADVLVDVAKNPRDWFPQLGSDGKGPDGENMSAMLELSIENIVLVDDVRTNFQSGSEAQHQILRYCKVARYDSEYREMGLVTNMGGLGGRNLDDYITLQEFVQAPWKFKQAHSIRLSERPFEDADRCPPVSLVVFDFDETLSIYTFMGESDLYKTEIGYEGKTPEEKQRLVTYNFESPYVAGDRVKKLDAMLRKLAEDKDVRRSLAVLTKNEDGAVAVLNLLLMANLAHHFNVIWTLGADPGRPNGVYRDSDGWKIFSLPLGNVEEQWYKAIVLDEVAQSPAAWLPQLAKDGATELDHLKDMKLFNIVLVDDQRSSFQSEKKAEEEEEKQVLRYCKIAHYDDVYRDQGLCVHMGGIGAKSDADYDKLVSFVETPWKHRMADSALDDMKKLSFCMSSSWSLASEAPVVELERRKAEDGTPGARSRTLSKSLPASF